jgi:hypothetical protein
MMVVSPSRLFAAMFFLIMMFCSSCFAEQLKFADWIGIAKPDPLTQEQSKKIGSYANDGISTLWLSDSDSDQEMVQLTLESKKAMAAEYYSYQIDRVDTLAIRSAKKGCESNCLIDAVPKKGELINTMQKGLQIKFEYDSDPDITQHPTFSLRGFSRAYNWLLSE